jgi:hypothetical protein
MRVVVAPMRDSEGMVYLHRQRCDTARFTIDTEWIRSQYTRPYML